MRIYEDIRCIWIKDMTWDEFCRPVVYDQENLDMKLITLVSDLSKEGILILLYRIIADNLAKELKLSTFTEYGTWYHKKQVGGWSQSFGGLREGKNVTLLTYATVRGAAHEVPFTSPSQALTSFRSFLNGSPIPRPHA
ncbi:unnamed protein product [Ilex paraguariensis]|uniref:Uncharacterized protein n=1 Tax=Ilex paraguariensis TaxID=185542 RepID=A0ABC8SHW8_9AQUA